MNNFTINFLGDFYVGNDSNSQLVSDNLEEFLSFSNFNIINCEAPVTTAANKIIKTGPSLKQNSSSKKLVKKLVEESKVFNNFQAILEKAVDDGYLD